MRDWYQEGRIDGEVANRTRGGTRGPEWLACQKNLEGADREDYIQGFNDFFHELYCEDDTDDNGTVLK
jgi:hypothetical protein